MKCKVLSCEFNNGKCLKSNDAELLEGGDGLYCSCYEEKKTIKLSKFKILEKTINSKKEIIVMMLTRKGTSGLNKLILEEINKKYKYKAMPKTLIFDCTCSTGTKAPYRYYSVKIENNKIVNPNVVYDASMLLKLKEITCKELLRNPKNLENSILTLVQKKMILKGFII